MTIRQPIITVCGHVDHGKCVSGDVLIPLSNGLIKDARTIFNESFLSNKAKEIIDGFSQDISSKKIGVFSFDGRNIVEKEISHIWRRRADKLIEVKLASGDIIKTTPEHPFFVFKNNALCEIRADELANNEYVAVPSKIKVSNSSLDAHLIEKTKELNNFVCFVNNRFDNIFSKLKDKNVKSIERKLSIKHISDSIRKRRFRIRDLFLIGNYLGLHDKDIYSVINSIKNSNEKQRAGHTSKELYLPVLNNLDNLGYLLGCIAGDGHISKTNVILNNNDPDVQEAYMRYLKEIFNVESKIKQGHTCRIVLDSCGRTFARFINEIVGIPMGNKSAIIEVPQIAMINSEVFKGFFAGLLDTDGYVSRVNNSIEITSKSQKIIKQCSTLLLNFGVLSSTYMKNGFYVLRVSNKHSLNLFLENFRPRLKRKLVRVISSYEKSQSSRIFDIIPLSKNIFKELKFTGKVNKDIPYYNKYIKSQNLSRDFLTSVINNIKENNHTAQDIKRILDMQLRFVKVISKNEIENKDGFVYDFTVPETHNFIAERILVHNTSILDAFRGTSLQSEEAGGITQKISFTKYPLEQIKKACPLIKEKGIDLTIPGFLFIDTPGHAAFTNLRKRGGSLADIAILVVDIKEGIKPQTAEVLSILRTNKTPFVIALNKIDNISGWQKRNSIKESIELLPLHAKQEFDLALLTFQSSMQSHGFNPELFYEISDFTKNVAIVPTSARSKEGISELLFVLAGLSQRFLTEKLQLSDVAKGVLLEIKKEKSAEYAEAILYDGELKEGDEIAIASFSGELIVTKIRSIQEILPLSNKYKPVKKAMAATGVRLQVIDKEGILSGMPFQKVEKNLAEIKEKFKKEISQAIKVDKTGIIAKADSLGSLEALLTLLRQANVSVVKAAIGPISKSDIVAAKANVEINPLDAIVVGFNVQPEEEIEKGNVKIITNEVVYKLIEDLELFRKKKSAEIEKERLMGLATICKLEILPRYVFRNSNPAIFGVKILAGRLRKNLPLIDQNGEEIARVKAIQLEKAPINEAKEGMEIAISLPGTNFERQLQEVQFLYSQLAESHFKQFKKNKDLLSQTEIKALSEILEIKRKKNSNWGI